MKNRFMLAPLTNSQSYENGIMSDEEFHWLTMRAKGGFGLTMTCASHIQAIGKGFPGQMGVFSDDHLEGLSRLAEEINKSGSISNVVTATASSEFGTNDVIDVSDDGNDLDGNTTDDPTEVIITSQAKINVEKTVVFISISDKLLSHSK